MDAASRATVYLLCSLCLSAQSLAKTVVLLFSCGLEPERDRLMRTESSGAILEPWLYDVAIDFIARRVPFCFLSDIRFLHRKTASFERKTGKKRGTWEEKHHATSVGKGGGGGAEGQGFLVDLMWCIFEVMIMIVNSTR